MTERAQQEAGEPVVASGPLADRVDAGVAERGSVSRADPADVVQFKLAVGAVDDPEEREADRVAEQVVAAIRRSGEPRVDGRGRSASMPRVRLKSDGGGVGVSGGELDIETSQKIQRSRGGGGPLADGVRADMERGFGADFSQVRIHADAGADRLSRSVDALAFTTGSDIFFRRGAYEPGSEGGRRLLAHELTHVVQQGGAVRRTALPRVNAGQAQVVRRKFAGDFEGLTFSGIKNSVPSLTYSAYNQLLRSDTTYTTVEQVEEALASLATAAPKPKQQHAPEAPAKKWSVPKRAPKQAPAPVEEREDGLPRVVPPGYSYKGTRSGIELYRADGRRPGQVKAKRGFTPKDFPTMKEVVALIASSPAGFAQAHVSTNRSDVVSTATDVGCGGYAANANYVYKMKLNMVLHEFLPPDPDGTGKAWPIIFTDGTGSGAKLIGFDPRKQTEELDFFADILTPHIVSYRPKGGAWTDINWSEVTVLFPSDIGSPTNYP